MVVTRSGKDTNENERHQVPESSKTKEEFQRILKERKDEAKRLGEMKRLEGLKKIRERNSRTGVEPLEHFPKEVWCLVLDELTPPDKASLRQVHPLFPDLMRGNQIRDILLPLILDHKKGIVQKYFSVLRWRLNRPLMELRLVSRSMRNAVEKWYEDDLLTLVSPLTETAWRSYTGWNSCKKPIQFQMNFDEAELQKILDIEKPFQIFKRDVILSLSTPVRGNAVLEEDVRLRYFNLFVTNVTKALEEVGDQIWRLNFHYQESQQFGVSPTQACLLFKEWLGHLPNVKWIELYFYEAAVRPSLMGNSSLWSEGFPTLPALKRLDLCSVRGSNAVELIADGIISANPQISMVTLNEPSNYRFMSRPSIRTLNLESCQLKIDSCPRLFKEIERTVGNFNWNLRMLELHFFESGVSVNSLIRFLNQFPTLNTIILSNYSIKFSDEDIDFLRLPNLTQLGIELREVKRRKYDRKAHFFFSLQFLLHSPNLESLTWTNYIYEYDLHGYIRLRMQLNKNEPSEDMLDFGGGYKDLSKSNLWNAFPKLRQIQVRYRESYAYPAHMQTYQRS